MIGTDVKHGSAMKFSHIRQGLGSARPMASSEEAFVKVSFALVGPGECRPRASSMARAPKSSRRKQKSCHIACRYLGQQLSKYGRYPLPQAPWQQPEEGAGRGPGTSSQHQPTPVRSQSIPASSSPASYCVPLQIMAPCLCRSLFPGKLLRRMKRKQQRTGQWMFRDV